MSAEPYTDDQTFFDDIEAYPGQLSYGRGESVTLHVSTRAPSYEVVIERWGASRDEVWRQTGVTGEFHDVPPGADSAGCDWPAAVELPVDDAWPSGFYLVTLKASGAPEGRDVAHAGFVVRSSKQRQRALLVLATNTWNAYNTWGGKSLYTGGKQVSFRRPFGRGMLCRTETERDDRKSRPSRRGEVLDADGHIFQEYRKAQNYPAAIGSTGWFTFERRFVEWAEGQGYGFDYAVSSDLEKYVDVLADYDVVLSVGHDEYWSAKQRDALETFVTDGGNLASFSGNTMFWQVRLEDDASTMVCHKYSAHETDPIMDSGDSSTMTGLWCDPFVGRPEWSLLGGGSAFGLYYRFGQAVAQGSGGFTVYRDKHWMFEGTGLRYGDVLGASEGAVGYEVLGCPLQFDDQNLPVARVVDGMPADVEIVAFVPASSLAVGEYPASISALSDQGDLEFVAQRYYGSLDDDARAKVRHGNAVMLTCRPYGSSGGEVVTIGTTDWAFALRDDRAVGQVTRNVLDRYGVLQDL